MTKDILFLLPAGFEDNGRREYCPECAEIWGVLSYYPEIQETLDIRYQPIAKPRAELVEMLGVENQNCPTLVLAPDSEAGENVTVKSNNGHRFLDNARDIGKYFADRHGSAWPRGE
jgi:hypothetical protein